MLRFALVLTCLAAAQPFQQPPAATAPQTVPPAPPAAAPAIDSFEQRLASIDTRIALITDMRADFEQTRKTALLKKPLISRGTLVCKNDRILWHTTHPRESTMLVAGENVTVHYPADKLAEIYPMGARFKDAVGGPLPRLAKLRETFELSELSPDKVVPGTDIGDTTTRLAIKLTPRTAALRQYIDSVRVLIDTKVPCADRIVIVDPDGEETQLYCFNLRINTGVKDSELELKLPPETKINRPAGDSKAPAR
ncbi:MAG: outer membrane lipoprotein carrier protein LolA [Planctomycetota bacterium]|nr:outer membrane lipoprotein carrier protein LolA [Planctomycetota bacterium]